jgi:hypothetical protein
MSKKHCDCLDCKRTRIHQQIHRIWERLDEHNEADCHRLVACLALELADIADQERGHDTRN